MAFELPNLTYAHSALAERGMSQETLELHHDKHHQAYVTALNGFVDHHADLQGKSLEEILRPLEMTVDEFVRVCDKFTNKKIFKRDVSGGLIKDRDGNLTKLNFDNV